MHQTNASHNNCLALPPPTAATFKVGQAVTNLFLQPLEPYSTYADNFDLSLLPQDCSSPTENIPTTVYQYTNTSGHSSSSLSSSSPPPQIKIEQSWSSNAVDDIKQEPTYTQLYDQLKSPNQLIPPPAYPHIYPSPQSSPAQSEYGFPHTQFPGCYDSLSSSRTSLYPESPCPSLDASSIKQELHILPPSPPESNCEAPSPHSLCSDIKSEPFDSDVETTLIDLNSLLENPNYNDLSAKKEIDSPTPPQDYQLLREYLEDTTFQKKHNLKPLALESFIGGLAEEVRGDIEPVISLALEHAKREADATCAKLQISQDPSAWSPLQVHAWLRSTIAQFRLPQVDDLESKFSEDGAALILLSDEEFTRRAPEIGSTLHAQLEIWKLAYADGYQSPISQPLSSNEGNLSGSMQQSMWSADGLQSINMDLEDESEDDEELLPSTSTSASLSNGHVSTSTPTTIAGATTQTKRPAGTPGRTGGSHIHLWQFLKELLASPHINGTAIRWIDRSKGIFKIEDSVRVAKLWGKRKNRPAMNYDKLSRSIRQYYKKGIMKKTERSQRLVYQFCHPYHL